MGPTNTDPPVAVAVDASDNVFVVRTGKDLFYVQKLDPSGNELWRRSYGAGAFATSNRFRAATDAAGRLVVVGEFSSTGDFDGVSLAALGNGDAFVVLLDPAGDILWRRTFGSADKYWDSGIDGSPGNWAGVDTGPTGVAFDAAGDVLLVGDFGGHVDFGSGVLDPANGSNFVTKLSGADGTPLWGHPIAGSWLPLVAADPGGAVVVASTVEPEGGVLVTKLDAAGVPLFQAKFAGGASAGPRAVRVDGSGNILMVGTFEGSGPDFGQGALTGGGTFNDFLVSLAPGGAVRWTGVLQGPGFIANARLDVDAQGDAVVATECEGPVSYGGMSIAPKASRDICLVRFDANGAPLATGLFSTALGDTLSDMALTHTGEAVIAGGSGDLYGGGMSLPPYVTKVSM